MRLAWLAITIASSLGLVACVPPPVYRVQRTARVPHPAVPLRTGEPLDGPIELSVGMNSVGDAVEPELKDKQASVEIPSRQMRGELRARLGREGARGEIAAIYEQSTEGSMHALDPTQAPVGEGQPTGLGFATRYSFATGVPGFSIGTGIEVMTWAIPYVEYRTCVAYCDENSAPSMQTSHGTENVGTFGFAFTPTYRTGNLAIYGGAYARRHPTIERKGTEQYVDSGYDDDVAAGAYNFMVHAGVEYRLPVISLLATVQQDLTAAPVQYGPTLGFAIALRAPNRAALPYHDPTPEPAPPPVILTGPPGGATAANDTGNDPDGELPDDPW